MAENTGKESENKGCLIFIIIYVIAQLIYLFATTSSAEFANFGYAIMGVVALAVSYFVIKWLASLFSKSDKNVPEKKENGVKGCLTILICIIAILIIVGFILNTLTSSHVLNESVGVIFLVVFIVGFGIVLYFNMKE